MCFTKACQGVCTSIQVQELNRSNRLCNLQIMFKFFILKCIHLTYFVSILIPERTDFVDSQKSTVALSV